MSNSAKVPVRAPGMSSLAPISHDLPSSGAKLASRVWVRPPPMLSGAMVALGLNDSL
ncbi:hypothetical protein D3C80_2167720 [compost metagenome]